MPIARRILPFSFEDPFRFAAAALDAAIRCSLSRMTALCFCVTSFRLLAPGHECGPSAHPTHRPLRHERPGETAVHPRSRSCVLSLVCETTITKMTGMPFVFFIARHPLELLATPAYARAINRPRRGCRCAPGPPLILLSLQGGVPHRLRHHPLFPRLCQRQSR
jgi:hypothetical protein